MRCRRRTEVTCVICVATVLVAGLAWAVEPAPTSHGSRAPVCVIATVDGVPITGADADRLRALLQPPPDRRAAAQLAVDAALAWRDLHGPLTSSATAKERLAAWRAWLQRIGEEADGPSLGRHAQRELERVGCRARLRYRCECPEACVTRVEGASRWFLDPSPRRFGSPRSACDGQDTALRSPPGAASARR